MASMKVWITSSRPLISGTLLGEAIVPCDHKGEAVDKDGRQLDPDKLRPEDVEARGRVDALIKDNVNSTWSKLPDLSSKQLQIIREFIDKYLRAGSLLTVSHFMHVSPL